MTANEIKAIMAAYWRYKRQAAMVAFERGIDVAIHIPDVQVVTKDRRMVEIEVKITMADFRADAKKRIWMFRDRGIGLMPYQFYYAMPYDLAESVKADVRPDCGLLGVLPIKHRWERHSDRVICLRRAPRNKEAGRLSLKKCVQMVKHQTGTLCSMAERLYITTEDPT
jgi:hypothetical protein